MAINRKKEAAFWPIMTSLFLGAFLTSLGASTVNLALTDLMQYFHTGLDSVKWIMTGFMLTTGAVAPITRYLGEKFSFQRLYLTALAGYTVISLFCILAWDIGSLIFFRMLQGAFAGLVAPATMTIIYQVIPRYRQAGAISLWSVSAMLAPAFGLTISGWLIASFNWKAIFLLNIPLGLLAILLVSKFTPFYRLSPPEKFDFPGFATSIIAGLLLLTAFSEGSAWGWSSRATLLLMAAGLALLAVFVRWELSSPLPALNIRIFKSKGYTMSIIVKTVVTVSLYAGSLLTPLFLQEVQRLSALDAGMVMFWPSVAMAVSVYLVGKVYDRLDPRLIIISGIFLLALGSLQMSRLTPVVSHTYIILWMTVRNIGIAFCTMPVTNLGMSALDRKSSGNGSSISNWVGQSVGSLSIGVFTSLLTFRTAQHLAGLGQAGSSQAMTAALLQSQAFVMGVNDVYFASFLVILIALPLSLLLKKEIPAEEISRI